MTITCTTPECGNQAETIDLALPDDVDLPVYCGVCGNPIIEEPS